MKISTWLKKFRKNWKKRSVDKVLELFTDDVDYYETPSTKLEKQEIRSEWENVKQQEEISLELEVFSSTENRHTVQWELSYTQDGEQNNLKGIYLIKLNQEGKCTEFWQYCQSE